MYNVVIDTCVWLNMCSNVVETKIIDKLTEFVKEGKVRIIVPEIIVEEWNRLKVEKIVKQNEASIKGKLKNIKELFTFIDSDHADVLQEIIRSESSIKSKVKDHAHKSIKKIDFLLNYQTTRKITINDEVKNQVVMWGLEKKAPFHKKSSMADALIILSTLYYIKSHSLQPSIFVTCNTDDFSGVNKKVVHDDLEELFKKANLEYSINIGEALNKIEENSIGDELIKNIEKQSNELLCYKCGAPMDNGSWQRSQYGGLTWQYTCCACRARYDTGEFYD